jgi:hypothetical protein
MVLCPGLSSALPLPPEFSERFWSCDSRDALETR